METIFLFLQFYLILILFLGEIRFWNLSLGARGAMFKGSLSALIHRNLNEALVLSKQFLISSYLN